MTKHRDPWWFTHRGGYVGQKPRTLNPTPPRLPKPTPPPEHGIWESRYRVAREELGDLVEAVMRIEHTPHGDECRRSNRTNDSIECDCHQRIARDALAQLGRRKP